MSKLETPITRAYWQQVGGTLVEEYPVVTRAPGVSPRWVDGLILPHGPNRIARSDEVNVDGQEIILVQTKAKRLGLSLMGQALFSRELVLLRHRPTRVRSIALCTEDDVLLRPLLERFEGVEVVVMPLSANSMNETAA